MIKKKNHAATRRWWCIQILQIRAEGIQLDQVEDGRGHKIQEAVPGDSLNNTMEEGKKTKRAPVYKISEHARILNG